MFCIKNVEIHFSRFPFCFSHPRVWAHRKKKKKKQSPPKSALIPNIKERHRRTSTHPVCKQFPVCVSRLRGCVSWRRLWLVTQETRWFWRGWTKTLFKKNSLLRHKHVTIPVSRQVSLTFKRLPRVQNKVAEHFTGNRSPPRDTPSVLNGNSQTVCIAPLKQTDEVCGANFEENWLKLRSLHPARPLERMCLIGISDLPTKQRFWGVAPRARGCNSKHIVLL